MAQNKVKFQKGVSLPQFLSLYCTEEQCFDALFTWRWPNGFCCSECGCTESWRLTSRKLQQCNQCHHQTFITSYTIFQSSKLPLRIWFLGVYFFPQDKKGISSLELKRCHGISYKAACRMKHKFAQVMLGPDEAKRGRDSENKTPFMLAVQTTEQGQPVAIKLQVIDGFRYKTIAAWAKSSISPGSTVISDGLVSFNAITEDGCEHVKIVCGGGAATVEEPEFLWINTVLGNLKSDLRSTYHSIKPKHAKRYLAEFKYRFNRCYDLPELKPRLAFVSLRAPLMPERLLRL